MLGSVRNVPGNLESCIKTLFFTQWEEDKVESRETKRKINIHGSAHIVFPEDPNPVPNTTCWVAHNGLLGGPYITSLRGYLDLYTHI